MDGDSETAAQEAAEVHGIESNSQQKFGGGL